VNVSGVTTGDPTQTLATPVVEQPPFVTVTESIARPAFGTEKVSNRVVELPVIVPFVSVHA
jgi:hypothetical protein